MAEIRDGTIKEVLEKLRRPSYEMEEINKRLGTVDRTGDTLDDLRVRVDYSSNEMADLRRQVERGSASMPPQNQQAGRVIQRLGRAGIRRFRPRGGHQNSPFRG